MRDGIIAVLDVGSSKAACIIARVEPDGSVLVLGIGNRACEGVRSGAVTDMAATEEAIRTAVDQAERMAGVSVEGVTLLCAAGYPKSRIVEMEVAIDRHEITQADIEHAIAEARSKMDIADQRLLHNFPAAFAVDGTFGVKNPAGMTATTLSVAMHVITVSEGPVKNLERCVQRAHLEVDDVIVSPYASGLASLVDDELQIGAACVDIGGGTTDVSIFAQGAMVHAEVLPQGGRAVTEEIARHLLTPIGQAERLKTLAGSAICDPAHERDFVDVPQVGENSVGGNLRRVPRSELTAIMQAEYERQFMRLGTRLDAMGFVGPAGQHVVLTGGAALSERIRDLAQQILGRHVRIARHRGIPGLPESAQGPQFSAVIGLLGHAIRGEAGRTNQKQRKRQKNTQNLAGKVTEWFRRNF